MISMIYVFIEDTITEHYWLSNLGTLFFEDLWYLNEVSLTISNNASVLLSISTFP